MCVFPLPSTCLVTCTVWRWSQKNCQLSLAAATSTDQIGQHLVHCQRFCPGSWGWNHSLFNYGCYSLIQVLIHTAWHDWVKGFGQGLRNALRAKLLVALHIPYEVLLYENSKNHTSKSPDVSRQGEVHLWALVPQRVLNTRNWKKMSMRMSAEDMPSSSLHETCSKFCVQLHCVKKLLGQGNRKQTGGQQKKWQLIWFNYHH